MTYDRFMAELMTETIPLIDVPISLPLVHFVPELWLIDLQRNISAPCYDHYDNGSWLTHLKTAFLLSLYDMIFAAPSGRWISVPTR